MTDKTKATVPAMETVASESSSSGNRNTKTTKPSRLSIRKKAGIRGRNWATLIYPDSVADDWREQLAALCIPVFASPLQDADKADNADGIAKPHRHILLMFNGNKSQTQVQEIVERFGGVGVVRIESKTGYARYLCHMDNPEKAQYKAEDVLSFGGADYALATRKKGANLDEVKDMIYFVRKYQVRSIAELIDLCMASGQDDWLSMLLKPAVCGMIDKYIKSMAWEDTKGRELMYKEDANREANSDK